MSDPERSSGSSDGEGSDGEDVREVQEASANARSLITTSMLGEEAEGASQRRASHRDLALESAGRDVRADRPHEPAWQTLYSRRRSPMRGGRASAASGAASMNVTSNSIGPAEGDLDPWDMQDVQERLAALSHAPADPTPPESISSDAVSSSPSPSLIPCSPKQDTRLRSSPHHPRREIYAYHLTTATLEAFINPLLSSLRSLRLITITFYPGHLLDDDKLEHMLRRILSPHECPRLQTLLLRIVFDAASGGSRMRRFERTKTIAGAADRIGDERVRVMLVHNRVGEGELVRLNEEEARDVSAVSRKAILLTKEGWWARVLQHNHLPMQRLIESAERSQLESEALQADKATQDQEQRWSNWSLFFPPSQHANSTHLVNLVHHCDPWPDCPNPVT